MTEKILWNGTLIEEKDKHNVLPVSLNNWVLSLLDQKTWEMTKEASEEIVKVVEEQWLSIADVLRVIYNKAITVKNEYKKLENENDQLTKRVKRLEEKLHTELWKNHLLREKSVNFIKDEISKLSNNEKEYILSWKWPTNRVMINYINNYRKNLKENYNNNYDNKDKIWKQFLAISEIIKKINLEEYKKPKLYDILLKDLYIELWWSD